MDGIVARRRRVAELLPFSAKSLTRIGSGTCLAGKLPTPQAIVAVLFGLAGVILLIQYARGGSIFPHTWDGGTDLQP